MSTLFDCQVLAGIIIVAFVVALVSAAEVAKYADKRRADKVALVEFEADFAARMRTRQGLTDCV